MDTQTLYDKLSTVPPPIRTRLGSEEVMSAIQAINGHFKVSDKNQYIISKLLLRLQIKDLDAEYFTGEIASQLNIDKNNALLISAEIKRVILSPIRKEFLDYGINIDLLEKFQMPLLKPKILEEVKTTPVPKPPAAEPTIISQTFQAIPKAPAMPIPPKPGMPPIPTPPPAAPKPSLSGEGWSKQAAQQPVVKFGAINPGVPIPPPKSNIPTPPPVRPNPQPTASTPIVNTKGMDEFQRLDVTKKPATPITPAKPATPMTPPVAVKPPEPAPVMLHQVSGSSPIQAPSELNMNLKAKEQISAAQRISPTPMTSPSSTKPAVLEFGSSPSSATAPKPAPNPQLAPPPPSSMSSGPRQVTEITSSMRPGGVTAPPPMPPKPPTPPTPLSASGKEKVVVKDFLGPQQ